MARGAGISAGSTKGELNVELEKEKEFEADQEIQTWLFSKEICYNATIEYGWWKQKVFFLIREKISEISM